MPSVDSVIGCLDTATSTRGFAYDDPDVAIVWPTDIPLLVSERDVDARGYARSPTTCLSSGRQVRVAPAAWRRSSLRGEGR